MIPQPGPTADYYRISEILESNCSLSQMEMGAQDSIQISVLCCAYPYLMILSSPAVSSCGPPVVLHSRKRAP